MMAPGTGLRRHLPALVTALVCGLLACSAAAAPSDCLRDCADLACRRQVVDCCLESGQAAGAIAYLKPLVAGGGGDDGALALLLARAYLAADNPFWAERTLTSRLERAPEDCAARAWLAWIRLGQGDPDLAADTLVDERCPVSVPDRARWSLLRLAVARAKDDREGQLIYLEHAASLGALWPEDGQVLDHYRRLLQARWQNPVRLRAEMGLGYTSDVSAGLPLTQAAETKGSPLFRLDLFGRVFWSFWPDWWPTLEVDVGGQFLEDYRYGDGVDVHQANHLALGLRPGLTWHAGDLRGFVGYRGELFVLNSADRYGPAPSLYYEGHRLALDLETPSGWTVFGGGGKRIFRQAGRTRYEVDGGVGWGVAPAAWFHVLAAVSGRYYPARDRSFDRAGGTAILVGRFGLPADLLLRLGLNASIDHYPHAERASGSAGRGGEDWSLKPTIDLWGPAWAGLRLGLGYSYLWRSSEVAVSYDLAEHRALLKLRLVFDLNPWGAEILSPEGHVPLPYGLGAGAAAGLDDERIQDLLRQDETARRGSSCVN